MFMTRWAFQRSLTSSTRGLMRRYIVLLVALAACHRVSSDRLTAAIQTAVTAPKPPRYAAGRWKLMQAIYRDRSYSPLWLDRQTPRQQTRDLLDAVTRADEQGLRIRDYDLSGLRAALDSAYHKGRTTERELAALDLRLSALYLEYGHDLLAGRLDPAVVDSGWYIITRRRTVDSTLQAAARGKDFPAMVAPLVPHQKEYGELLAGLKSYRQAAAMGGWPQVPGSGLKPGTRGPAVSALRTRLSATGDLSDAAGDVYDASVGAGVRRFQARHGIDTSGTVDRATLDALNVPVDRRIRQIEINLDRLRWLPNEFGERYVLVNIPAFTLHAFDAGHEVLTMRVVVGSEYGHATPVFADTLRYVVFRPYWNVPKDIVAKEILPRMQDDRNYLAHHHYEVVRGEKGQEDRVVDPKSIDWHDVDTAKMNFRVRQQPGDDNSLGLVKFMFPNQFDIYMHDTPARSLFGRNARALSHGCIRLERPDQFAEYVFEGDDAWGGDSIQQAMHADSSRTVSVKRGLPVYIVYLTAFSSNGQLQFRDDLYGADARALSKLSPAMPDSGLDSARTGLHDLLKRS